MLLIKVSKKFKNCFPISIFRFKTRWSIVWLAESIIAWQQPTANSLHLAATQKFGERKKDKCSKIEDRVLLLHILSGCPQTLRDYSVWPNTPSFGHFLG